MPRAWRKLHQGRQSPVANWIQKQARGKKSRAKDLETRRNCLFAGDSAELLAEPSLLEAHSGPKTGGAAWTYSLPSAAHFAWFF